jgi:hypothetical protein
MAVHRVSGSCATIRGNSPGPFMARIATARLSAPRHRPPPLAMIAGFLAIQFAIFIVLLVVLTR